MKIVISRLFKKYLKRRKSRARFCLPLGWLDTSEKNIEHCYSVGAGAHKVGKVVRLWPNFDPNSPDTVFGKYEKGKLHILKKVGLSTFK